MEHWQGSNLKTLHKAYLNVQEDKQTDDLSNNRPCSCFNRVYLHKYLLFHNKEFNSWNTAEALVGGQKEHGTNSTNSKTVGSIKNVIQMWFFHCGMCRPTHSAWSVAMFDLLYRVPQENAWLQIWGHSKADMVRTAFCYTRARTVCSLIRSKAWKWTEFPIFFLSLISWEFKNPLAAQHMSDKRQGNLAVTLL